MSLWRDFDRWCERRTGSPAVSVLSGVALTACLIGMIVWSAP